jgi:hypothetical protein
VNIRFLILCGVILGLSGCAMQQAQGQFNNKFAAEEVAWNEIGTLFSDRCGKGKSSEELENTPKRDEVVQLVKCMSKLVNEKVIPAAVYPDLVLQMRATTLRNAEAYANGKISSTEWEARANETWADYTNKINERVNNVLIQAAQQDELSKQRFSQGFSQGFNQGSYGYYPQPAFQPIQNQQFTPMMQTTNCRGMIDGSMKCTTW